MPDIPIASLTEALVQDETRACIKAVVTLIWPYSSVTGSCAFLLVEPDYRLRNDRGQVRVRFHGECAQAIAKAGTGIGDEVRLKLDGARWIVDNASAAKRTPGRSVDGDLCFTHKLSASIVRAGQTTQTISVSTKPTVQPTPNPLATPVRSNVAYLPDSQAREPYHENVAHSSPAFIKTGRFSEEHMVTSSSVLDVLDEDILDDDSPRKRRRIESPRIVQWRYAGSDRVSLSDITPSSALAMQSGDPQQDMPPTEAAQVVVDTHSPAEATELSVKPQVDDGRQANASSDATVPALNPNNLILGTSLQLPKGNTRLASLAHLNVKNTINQGIFRSSPSPMTGVSSAVPSDGIPSSFEDSPSDDESDTHEQTRDSIHVASQEDDEAQNLDVTRAIEPESTAAEISTLPQSSYHGFGLDGTLLSRPRTSMLEHPSSVSIQAQDSAEKPSLAEHSVLGAVEAAAEPTGADEAAAWDAREDAVHEVASAESAQAQLRSSIVSCGNDEQRSDVMNNERVPSHRSGSTSWSDANAEHPCDAATPNTPDFAEVIKDQDPPTTAPVASVAECRTEQNIDSAPTGHGDAPEITQTDIGNTVSDVSSASEESESENMSSALLNDLSEGKSAMPNQEHAESVIHVSDMLSDHTDEELPVESSANTEDDHGNSMSVHDPEQMGHINFDMPKSPFSESAHFHPKFDLGLNAEQIEAESVVPESPYQELQGHAVHVHPTFESETDNDPEATIVVADHPMESHAETTEVHFSEFIATEFLDTTSFNLSDRRGTLQRHSLVPATSTGRLQNHEAVNMTPGHETKPNTDQRVDPPDNGSRLQNASTTEADKPEVGAGDIAAVERSTRRRSRLSVIPGVMDKWFTSKGQNKELRKSMSALDKPLEVNVTSTVEAALKSPVRSSERLRERRRSSSSAAAARPTRSTKGTAEREEPTTKSPTRTSERLRNRRRSSSLAAAGPSVFRISQGSVSTDLSFYPPLTDLGHSLNQQSGVSPGVDLIGIVTSASTAPARAKSGPRDWFTSFYMTDPSLCAKHDSTILEEPELQPQTSRAGKDVRVDVFRPWKASLPRISVGDVVLLRSFVTRSRLRRPFMLSAEASAWCVWRHCTDGSAVEEALWTCQGDRAVVSEEVLGPPVEIGEQERARVRELRAWWITRDDVSRQVEK